MGGRRAGRRLVYSILNWVPWQAGSDACAGEASGLHSGVQIGSTGALDGFMSSGEASGDKMHVHMKRSECLNGQLAGSKQEPGAEKIKRRGY